MQLLRAPLLISMVLALLISGCETSTKRNCPAFFHPDYEIWSQQAVGETLAFVDQNGARESFEVMEITQSDTFQTEDFGSRESDVSCDLTVREVLFNEDLNESILKLFEHGEFSDKELANETFFLSFRVFKGDVESSRNDFLINLKEREGTVTDAFSEQRFDAELEVGGVLYNDAITARNLTELSPEEGERISAVTIASGFGLVQYTRVDGSVFSRLP